jgi:hypothetical protein
MAKRSILRIVQVTLALSALGAVAGGILGGGLVALLGIRIGSLHLSGEVLLAGTEFGAAMGGVLAPLAAWTLMRRVPIWRALTETALGTVLGCGVGLIFQPLRDTAWLSPPLLGIAGFILAAIRLRFRVRTAVPRAAFDVQAG